MEVADIRPGVAALADLLALRDPVILGDRRRVLLQVNVGGVLIFRLLDVNVVGVLIVSRRSSFLNGFYLAGAAA